MRSARSFRIPRCSQHDLSCRRDDQGQWFCVECVDEILNAETETGIALPAGVKVRSVTELMPNRRIRRRLAHGA